MFSGFLQLKKQIKMFNPRAMIAVVKVIKNLSKHVRRLPTEALKHFDSYRL